MAKEAEAHADEDKARREQIEAKNQLDTLLYSVEKMLREHGDKISGSERGDVENAIADAKKALDSNDKQQMDQARERLTQASHKLAEQMYRATQAQGAAGAGPATGAGPAPGGEGEAKKQDQGVVDAEYEDMDERKSA
jgi:molecular chaperone DnaK